MNRPNTGEVWDDAGETPKAWKSLGNTLILPATANRNQSRGNSLEFRRRRIHER